MHALGEPIVQMCGEARVFRRRGNADGNEAELSCLGQEAFAKANRCFIVNQTCTGSYSRPKVNGPW